MLNRKVFLIILILASFAIHFSYFGHPNQIVFDEVHFGKFISAYYTHQYYFDIHPPLGKLLIAGFAKLFHFQPDYSFATIGEAFPDQMYMILRFLPSLFGALLPIIVFFLALELGLKPLSAFAAGMFTALDNALLTQSRYILLDMFLLCFGFAALLFYFRYRNGKGAAWKNLLIMAILGGCAASIKWTGLAFLGLAGVIELIHVLRTRALGARTLGRLVLYFALVPFFIYFSVFAVHFSLLTKSGDGDAFMTPEFRATLQGSTEYGDPAVRPLSLFHKFTELNHEMYEANETLTATHPYGSKWYTWPFMIRPIYYWNSGQLGDLASPLEGKIYLLGNPLVWWGSTVAVVYVLIELFSARPRNRGLAAFLIGGYALNLLPFIGISRVMFLYHYFSALIFAILMIAYCLDRIDNARSARIVVGTLTLLALLTFLYFAPLSYGLPLSPQAFDGRLWLSSWL
ncbi:MAG TPA: phospholipid carrier-dependent glycosyltransferase [Candidatus Paceibacterota bacterium]|nr:phospholipid carrier-dependent glycosyltransferase [Candidatus Paceibacterota bacterium]